MNLSPIVIATAVALVACRHDTAGPSAEPTTAPGTTPGTAAARPASSPTRDALADGSITREEHDDIQRRTTESLAKLQSLAIVEVGQLIVDAPAASFNCYGPCENDADTRAWMLEHAKQSLRLDELLAVASRVKGKGGDDVDRMDAALQALRALAIVEIDGIFHDSGRCDRFGCPESISATVALADALAKR